MAISQGTEGQDVHPLPHLRQDLQFLGQSSGDGDEKTWLLFDPVQNAYHKLDRLSFHLVVEWSVAGDVASLVNVMKNKYGTLVNDEEIAQLSTFLSQHGLCEVDENSGWEEILKRKKQRQNSFLWKIVHNYLFFKFPLFYPNSFLKATLPFVRPMLGKQFAYIMLTLGVLGLYLTLRQWEQFLTTFSEIFSFQYIVMYTVVLAFVKIIHEMGHAFVAAKHKCRVPSMGVAFILLFPILYTDVSDSWRLPKKKHRLQIDLAGIGAELYLAIIATLFWVFLPEGFGRTIAFSVATTGWILSLAINLNPFMRFDGYYILSDTLGVDNLQQRSFELGRWRLREILFKPNTECPEDLPEARIKFLTLYAWGTWLYRFFLFLGIALLVYHFAFKVLGIILFAIEIFWFILRPIFSEVKAWYKMAGNAGKLRTSITGLVLAACIAFVIIPLPFKVSIPAVVEPKLFQRVYAPQSAKITEINVERGTYVNEGDVLFKLSSDILNQELEINRLEILEAKAELRQSLIDIETRHTVPLINERIAKLDERRKGLSEQQDKLVIMAPISGEVISLAKDLSIEQWVQASSALVSIIDASSNGDGKNTIIKQAAKGYIAEADLKRVKLGNRGVFVPEDVMLRKIDVSLVDLHVSNIENIDQPYLASIYGAAVPVRRGEQNELKSLEAKYVSIFAIEGMEKLDRVHRGTILVDADKISLLSRAFSRVSAVLIREMGI